MDKFTKLEGVAAPLKMVNIDTDMIIPKNYLKTVKRTGLGKGLFAEKRYNEDGSENPDFVLNKPAYRNAKIIVADDNFGCGSSREHAPWALEDYGFHAIVAPSFADIFRSNCTKIGLLPVELSASDCEAIAEAGEAQVDLAGQEVRWPGGSAHFDIDPEIKHRLVNGLDDIALTLEQNDAIDAFESGRERHGPVTTAL
jgi:3-isopropylmalate/(R)-2-methylmalate dehydratase small subunit